LIFHVMALFSFLFYSLARDRQLSRIIQDFGALSLSGNVYAHYITERPGRGPVLLANMQRFNLNASDAVQILHLDPPTNIISLRSQEERLYGNFQINRFDYLLSSSSLMRLFLELN
jgi:hypothetical protein